ncbi:hypothetical protein DBR40_21565 [Pedobacter sp. KBW01]|uniref:hypothetical protein n=1 Tax=Pedobacter sp. KBW01 TaxID=2153364 RepID=UPI000F5A7296|nr:hypothetical protein [Pedobacter sp. KBW01]RQO66844.1 hypothetical protein DBR40_21565 [Pedobacter sp. KBW01]
MAKQTLNTIKNWFKTGLKPTQQQFWDSWDSFWHKDQVIPSSSVENLDARFDEKADDDAFQNHLTDDHAHNMDVRLAHKVSVEQLEAESTARSNGYAYLQGQVDELFASPQGSLEMVRALDNKILGDIDFNGNRGMNVATPEENGQIANKEYADQKEINAKNYADLVATDVLRYAGNWDASTGQYPTSGTGLGGEVRRGDSFEITVEGTIEDKEYEVGDQLRAKVDVPGQILANWGSSQVNMQQATEVRTGIAKVATTAQAIDRLSDTEMMTPAKTGATISAEKKWFKFQIAMTRETEQAILMEYSGQVNSSLLGGCNTLKLKIGVEGAYPNEDQTYPFIFNTGDRVFFTFNYDDLMFAQCNVILSGKYN